MDKTTQVTKQQIRSNTRNRAQQRYLTAPDSKYRQLTSWPSNAPINWVTYVFFFYLSCLSIDSNTKKRVNRKTNVGRKSNLLQPELFLFVCERERIDQRTRRLTFSFPFLIFWSILRLYSAIAECVLRSPVTFTIDTTTTITCIPSRINQVQTSHCKYIG